MIMCGTIYDISDRPDDKRVFFCRGSAARRRRIQSVCGPRIEDRAPCALCLGGDRDRAPWILSFRARDRHRSGLSLLRSVDLGRSQLCGHYPVPRSESRVRTFRREARRHPRSSVGPSACSHRRCAASPAPAGSNTQVSCHKEDTLVVEAPICDIRDIRDILARASGAQVHERSRATVNRGYDPFEIM